MIFTGEAKILLWKRIIHADVCSKSTSRKIILNPEKKIRVIKSAPALRFVEDFGYQARKVESLVELPIKEDLVLFCYLYYRDRRKDLDESLVMDCLQKFGIIKNDRQIREKHIYGFVDADDPRVEIELWNGVRRENEKRKGTHARRENRELEFSGIQG